MSGLNFAFGLVVAVLLAASLFRGRKPNATAVILIIVGWGALVFGNFAAELFAELSRGVENMVDTLFQTVAGAGLVIGSMLELLSKKPSATT